MEFVNYWPYYSYSPYYKYGSSKPSEDAYFRTPYLRRNYLADYGRPTQWNYDKMGTNHSRTEAGVRKASTRMMLSGKFALAYCKPSAE
ncbi:hypothetical protein niasHT_011469 [Heterodera trifolii]|uniref:Uncharacterized protein n=1 Tax=Heterodera trifolii TaxID=157864 RepID=A0ABD2L1F6_9BILA